jgi:hypothetical protein
MSTCKVFRDLSFERTAMKTCPIFSLDPKQIAPVEMMLEASIVMDENYIPINRQDGSVESVEI